MKSRRLGDLLHSLTYNADPCIHFHLHFTEAETEALSLVGNAGILRVAVEEQGLEACFPQRPGL